jgi:MFS family permease
MKLDTKRDIEKAIGGLFFMIINTVIWTLIAEYYLEDKDNRIVGVLIGIVVLGFLFFYMRFTKFNKTLPDLTAESKTEEEAKKDKRFLWIFGLEGLGIFLAKNILVNINHNELFIPFFALIVGLHFFPLGKLFKRKFDYYMGIWTSTVAIMGLYIIIQKITTVDFANAIVSICCAVSTICYGIKMIISGQNAMTNNIK